MSSSKIVISTADGKGALKADAFDLYYEDATGKDIKLNGSGTYSIEKYATQTDEIPVNFAVSNFTSFVKIGDEKIVKLKLKTKTTPAEVVGTASVTVNRIHPEIVKVSTSRQGTEKSGLKFRAKLGSDIVKLYYIISNESLVSDVDTATKLVDTEKHADLRSVKVENNAFDAILDWDALENSTSSKYYTVYFVVENSAGNISNKVYKAVIPNDSSTEQAGQVTDVKIDDNLKVTFKAPAKGIPTNYTIIIYNEAGEVIDEVTTSYTASGTSISSKILEAGKYSVTVVSNGKSDGTLRASEETAKNEFEVTQLTEVTGLHFEENDEKTKVTLKWDTYKDLLNPAFSGYTIKLYEYDPKTETYKSSPAITKSLTAENDRNKTEIELKTEASFSPNDNTRYKAVIIANSLQSKVLTKNSETKKDYFNLKVTLGTSKKSDTEIQITVNNRDDIKKLGDTVTYDVEVWSKTKSSTVEEHFERVDVRKNVAVDKDGKMVIGNLDQDTEYKFVLVTHIDEDEAEGRSNLSNAISTYKALPSLAGIVVGNEAEAKIANSNKVYSDGTDLWINGEEVKNTEISEYYDPNKLLINKFGASLVHSLNEGDTIVFITEEKVTIKAANVATDGTAREIKATNRTLEMIGNINEQEIDPKSTDIKALILSGEGALFKFKDNTVNRVADISLNNGVKVTATVDTTKTFRSTIVAGAKATVNNIEIGSSANLNPTFAMQSSKMTLTIPEVGNDTITINNKSRKELVVEFDGNATIGKNQLGDVTIESNADITIKAKTTANVGADLTITATNGNVIIDSNQLTGNKNVTVSSDGKAQRTIKARTKLTSPVNLSNVEISPYTLEQLKDLRDNPNTTQIGGTNGLKKSNISTLTKDEDLNKLAVYFAAFGEDLMNKGITISNVIANQENVTITLPMGENVTINSATILGLK